MSQKPQQESTEIMFSAPNGPNGWLHLHSPHGFKYLSGLWSSGSEAWYSIIHDMNQNAILAGHYKTAATELPDSCKYGHLLGILKAKIANHPILESFLLDTGDNEIVYSVSKFASRDQKWLGLCTENDTGHNQLGNAWMEIRQSLLEKQ